MKFCICRLLAVAAFASCCLAGAQTLAQNAYITSFAGTVSVIATATNTVIATIPVGSSPFGAAVAPDGSTVYVTNFRSNTVSVISTATNTVTATIPVGPNPNGVAVTPDSRTVYVANNGSNTVSVIATATDTVSATITVGANPIGVVVTPDGSTVYVANEGSSTVSVIATATNTVTTTIPVGTTSVGVAVTPDGGAVYVASHFSDIVSVIATATNTVIATATNRVTATIPVGPSPFGVAVTPEGGTVYVANAGSNTVSVIATATNTVTATITVGSEPLAFGIFIIPPSGTLPPNFISPDVPHDVPTGPSASIQDLAIFAWREFIALNWVAMDPATTGMRGRPNVNLGVNAGFLSVKPDQNGNFPLVVWHTYRHKNELFPANGQTDAHFDSNTPTYNYSFNGQPYTPTAGPNAGMPPTPPTLSVFNNLDETSEIGLCQMFAHSTTRIAYEAKVSRALFDYANRNNLTNPMGNYSALTAAKQNTMNNLAKYGGTCGASTNIPIVSLPCGDAAVAGDPGEGAIEIKAAWRQLNSTEMASGRFFTQKVLFYEGEPPNQTYNNAVYGLVALHIIHKTKSFPVFVFASWEQIDNYDEGPSTITPNTEDLKFINLGYPNSTIYPNSPPPPNIPVTRNHSIHSQIPPVNDAVHAALTKIDPQTVWQYYKLIGVQATPVNGPPSPTAPSDDVSYYYLANIVVETNQTLQNFAGSLPLITAIPFLDVYLNGATGSPFQMGGCQGCHGAAGQSNGGDMSVLIGFGPSNAAGPPESINDSAEAAVKSYAVRSYGLIRARSLGLIPQ
jgi:YVTN family beta-propeller protein